MYIYICISEVQALYMYIHSCMYLYIYFFSTRLRVRQNSAVCVCMYNHIDWSLGGGARGPKTGNALQEVCVFMKWGTVVAFWGLAAGIIFVFCFFFFGNRVCAWTGTAPSVLGRGRLRLLGSPSHPPSSYPPKGGHLGYIHAQCTKCEVYMYT